MDESVMSRRIVEAQSLKYKISTLPRNAVTTLSQRDTSQIRIAWLTLSAAPRWGTNRLGGREGGYRWR